MDQGGVRQGGRGAEKVGESSVPEFFFVCVCLCRCGCLGEGGGRCRALG